MNAMLLAAGLGTRLAPLTARRPKCLMPVMNRPLLGLWLGQLASAGTARVVVNIHHLAGQVRSALAGLTPPGLEVVESHEPEILGTGGGLVAARDLLGREPFLLANADVLCLAGFGDLTARLTEDGAVAVLGLVDDVRFNTVALDDKLRVLGFKGRGSFPLPVVWLTYSGLAAVSPRLLDYLPGQGCSTLVDGLMAALADGQTVAGVRLEGYWSDLGTPKALLDLHRLLLDSPPAELRDLSGPGPMVLGQGARVDPDATVEGFAVLGQGARIEAGARVRDSLLLPGAAVLTGAVVEEAVLGDGFEAKGEITGGAHA